MLNFRCGRTPTSLLNYIYVLLIQAKVEACPPLAVMPQIQGGKGEAVPPLAGLRTLDNAEDRVSSAFLKGKQNRDKITEFISHQR